MFIIFSYYEKSFKYLKSINICIKEDINEEILIKFSQTFGKILSHLSIAGISQEKLSMVLSYFANKLKSIDFSDKLGSVLSTIQTLFYQNLKNAL